MGLLSFAAFLSLVMWYIFSFLTLFMNKYTLDALQAEPFLFCECHYLHICYLFYLLIFLCTDYFITYSNSGSSINNGRNSCSSRNVDSCIINSMQ